MFKLLDPENVLEHLVELLFAQNQLRGCAGGHPGLLLPGVLFPAVDGIELGHPGAQHGLLAEAVDLGEAAHPLLNVLLEDLPRVVGRAAPTLHHAGHAVALQEHLSENRAGKDIRKSVLETSSQASQEARVATAPPPLSCANSEVTRLARGPNVENENNNSS